MEESRLFCIEDLASKVKESDFCCKVQREFNTEEVLADLIIELVAEVRYLQDWGRKECHERR